MAKQTASASYMTPGERMGGTFLLIVCLLVLPPVVPELFQLAETHLGWESTEETRRLLCCDVLMVGAILLFHRFLGRTTRQFVSNLGPACRTMALGLIGLYGINELVDRLACRITAQPLRWNDFPMDAPIPGITPGSVVTLVVLAPFVEEVFFRGLVFGNLRERSRSLAYLVSGPLFALVHAGPFLTGGQGAAGVLLFLRFLVPGLILAWTYEESGTLWSPIGLHAVFNGLSLSFVS